MRKRAGNTRAVRSTAVRFAILLAVVAVLAGPAGAQDWPDIFDPSQRQDVVLVSHSFAGAASGTSIDGDKPTGTVEGDLLLAIMATDGDGRTLTAPGGWTAITDNIGASHTSRSWY